MMSVGAFRQKDLSLDECFIITIQERNSSFYILGYSQTTESEGQEKSNLIGKNAYTTKFYSNKHIWIPSVFCLEFVS